MKLVAKGWLIDTEFLLPVAFPDANQEFSCWVDGFVEMSVRFQLHLLHLESQNSEG